MCERENDDAKKRGDFRTEKMQLKADFKLRKNRNCGNTA